MKAIRIFLLLIILSGIAFVGLKSCSYINLKVSEKYETQMEGITDDQEQIAMAKEKAIEIKESKKTTLYQVSFSIIVIAVALFFYLRMQKSD